MNIQAIVEQRGITRRLPLFQIYVMSDGFISRAVRFHGTAAQAQRYADDLVEAVRAEWQRIQSAGDIPGDVPITTRRTGHPLPVGSIGHQMYRVLRASSNRHFFDPDSFERWIAEHYHPMYPRPELDGFCHYCGEVADTRVVDGWPVCFECAPFGELFRFAEVS